MVGNSLDEWQKDTFFAAAEEVQESTDAMESAYRIWLKEKTVAKNFDQLCSDLHTSLGTAKWQLEEFERAVKLSYGRRNDDDDDDAPARHAQFIAAIESQIARVESSLRDALNEQGKQPLRWVHLDHQESDDLALFLSAAAGTSSVSFHSPPANQEHLDHVCGNHHHPNHGLVNSFDDIDIVDDGKRRCKEATITKDNDADHVIHIENSPAMRDGVVCHLDTISSGTRGHCTSSNFRALRILVSNEDDQVKNPLSIIEDTPKEKELKPFFGRLRGGKHFLANGSMFNKEVLSRINIWRQQKKGPMQLKFVHSIRLTLVLMLSIFLIVPFLLYSS